MFCFNDLIVGVQTTQLLIDMAQRAQQVQLGQQEQAEQLELVVTTAIIQLLQTVKMAIISQI